MAYGGVRFASGPVTYEIHYGLAAREQMEAEGVTLDKFGEAIKSTKGLLIILRAGLFGHRRRIGAQALSVEDAILEARTILGELPHFQVARYCDEAFMLAIAMPEGMEKPQGDAGKA